MDIHQLELKQVTGLNIKKYLDQIGELRIQIFREFPYLYDGNKEYEKEYLQKYLETDDSLALLLFDGNNLVGCSTGIPLEDESSAFRDPFLKAGIDPQKVFYCGESVLRKEYRGLGIYKHFFTEREKHARNLGRFDLITFCAVVRPNNHPLKPDNYEPLDPVWEKYGYRKQPSIKAMFPWKDLNEPDESEKEMIFWTKPL